MDTTTLRQIAARRALGVPDALTAQALRLPLADAQALGLLPPRPWSHLAWRIEANRVRWRRRHWRT